MTTSEQMVSRWEEIRTLFSYSDEEQASFSYLGDYMRMISKRFADVSSDTARIRRFMLAGLFLTYRAYNHVGDSVTTKGATPTGSEGSKQLYYYELWSGETIENTTDYLSHLHFPLLLTQGMIFGWGRALYWFVLRG